MSGLIWAGIGKGISDAGASIGTSLMRSAERDEDRETRAELQRELQRDRLQDRAAAGERDAAVRLEIARMRAPSGGGGGGPGGLGLAMTPERMSLEAASAGMTVPDYEAYWNAIQTGNRDGLQMTQRVVARDDEYGPQLVESTGPMSEQQFAAKMQTLARVRERFTFGKDYKDMAEGQKTEIGIDVGRGVIAGAMPASAGAAVAASEGKPIMGGNSDVTRNLFTGATANTAVGDSVVRENNAKAGKASTDAANGRIEAQITAAQRALSDAIDKVTKRMPAISPIDALNPAKVAEHAANVQRAIDENPDIRQMRERLSALYRAGAGTPAARPAPGRPAPAAGAGPKRGDTQVVAAGPHKGKTATYDGTGWRLSN